MGCDSSLERFQAQPKWEIPVNRDTTASVLAVMLLVASSFANAQTLTLDKAAYKTGEPIRAAWSGSAFPNDKIGLFRDGAGKSPVDLWVYAKESFGAVAFTTPLPPGKYVAHLLEAGGSRTLTDGVPFSVSNDTDATGKIKNKPLTTTHLADPQVLKEGSTYYITGTYSGAGGNIYSTKDFENITTQWMEIDTSPWPHPYQHIWAFEIYKHTDGTWHGYAFDYGRGGLYHFLPDPDPATRTFPVLRWKEKELLLAGDYDNRVVHDGKDMYLFSAKGNSGNISIYAQRMLNPGAMDPNYMPRKIMSGASDALASELRNHAGAMKIHECPYIIKITAPGGTKYVLSYTVGDFGIRNYKTGFAYSNVMVPPPGKEYVKATMPDIKNVWGSGAGAKEVVYVTQSQKASWPNYHAAAFNRPGSGDIIQYQGDYYMIYHAAVPLQMDGMVGKRGYYPGRLAWIMPLTFDFTGSMDTWAKPGLLTTGAKEPSMRPNRTTYAPNEDIVIHFTNAAQGVLDWIGLYNSKADNKDRLDWRYPHGGTQTLPNVWAWERALYGFDGSVTFAGGLSAPGDYESRLFYNHGTDVVAARCAFKVVPNPNLPPAWSGKALDFPDAAVDRPYSGAAATLAKDPEGDTLTYSLISPQTWLRVAPNGDLSGTPTARYGGRNTFTLGVCDGNGDVVEATLNIIIPGSASNPAPKD